MVLNRIALIAVIANMVLQAVLALMSIRGLRLVNGSAVYYSADGIMLPLAAALLVVGPKRASASKAVRALVICVQVVAAGLVSYFVATMVTLLTGQLQLWSYLEGSFLRLASLVLLPCVLYVPCLMLPVALYAFASPAPKRMLVAGICAVAVAVPYQPDASIVVAIVTIGVLAFRRYKRKLSSNC
ncbi:MAG: hypothetical protein AB2L09_08945 [Coriobacteriia bacterium]